MYRPVVGRPIGVVVVLLLALGSAPVAAQTIYYACRVPTVGAIYMVEDAAAACLDESHVKFSWSEGGEPADGSITTVKLADGAVTSAKIAANAVTAAEISAGAVGTSEVADNSLTAADLAAGAAGRMAMNAIGSSSGIPTTVRNLGSVSITAPAAGTVFLAVTGYAITFGDNTTVRVGLGSSIGSFDIHSVSVGVLDGSGTQRRHFAFSPMSVVSVAAGTTTFYAAAQKPSVFSAATVNLADLRLIAIYQPS